MSPNVTAGYDTAPRYLDEHVAALEAAGYEVETFDIDAPPANGGTPNPVPRAQIKYPTYLGVHVALRRRQLLHRRRLRPAGRHAHQPAPPDLGDGADRQLRDGAVGAQGHARTARVRQQRRQAAHRRPQRAPAVHLDELEPVGDRPVHAGRRTSCSASSTRRTTRATTTCPAPPGSARAHRPTTPGRTTSASSAVRAAPGVSGTKFDAAPVTPAAGSLFAGMTPFTVDTTAGNNPTQDADGNPLPLAKSPLRLRNWQPRPTSRCARRRSRPTTRPPRPRPPTAARSCRRVTP